MKNTRHRSNRCIHCKGPLEDCRAGCPWEAKDTEPLTYRQGEVLHFIEVSQRQRGFPPSLREIGKALGIASTNGVSDHLKALERKGYLIRNFDTARGLSLLRKPAEEMSPWNRALDALPERNDLFVYRGRLGEEERCRTAYWEGREWRDPELDAQENQALEVIEWRELPS